MRTTDWNSFDRDVPVHQPQDTITPSGLAVKWLEHLEFSQGRSKATIRRYDLTVEQWLDWASTYGVPALEPSPEELDTFIRRPRKRQGHGNLGAPATRRAEVTHLRGWFGWMHLRQLVDTNPTLLLSAPTVPASLPKPIPDDHWIVLWESQLSPRMRLALGLGYFIGLRRKEITSLHGNQLTDELIIAFTRKGGGEDTLPWAQMLDVYLHEQPLPRLAAGGDEWAKSLLDHAAANRSRLLFWQDGQTMYKEMSKACRRAELPRYTPHQLRHSCATNLIRAGMPIALVSSLLNHSSFDITKRYIRAGGAELAEWRRSRTTSTHAGS